MVTGAPSYALAWPFPDPVHICALDAGRWVLELGTVAGAHELGAVYVSWAPDLGAPKESKVVTGAPSYALAWTFPEPVRSCATVRNVCRLGSTLARVGRWVLQQRVKW